MPDRHADGDDRELRQHHDRDSQPSLGVAQHRVTRNPNRGPDAETKHQEGDDRNHPHHRTRRDRDRDDRDKRQDDEDKDLNRGEDLARRRQQQQRIRHHRVSYTRMLWTALKKKAAYLPGC